MLEPNAPMQLRPVLLALVATLLAAAQEPATQHAPLGASASVEASGLHAFSYPAPVLSALERRAFAVGKSFFEADWITAPASASGRDGLGPLFNARSCSACHPRDGRARPPLDAGDRTSGLLLRLGLVEGGRALPHPLLGTQLQDRAIDGRAVEARVQVSWRDQANGLVAPHYQLNTPDGTKVDPKLRLSARIAPQLIGLGLLEAIPASQIIAAADAEDRNADGISGRTHFVFDRDSKTRVLGRFGWKATQPNVRQQVASALRHDIGITSPLFPDADLNPEIDAAKLERLSFYTRVLAVPAQRTPNAPAVARGRKLFGELACDACHTPTWTTDAHAWLPAYSAQTIHPYTDLLLHDMGAGLADELPAGAASGAEWRTPPLWGIGLFQSVNAHTRYLHDGRARNLREAILWHGGEAAASRDRFQSQESSAQTALLAFLGSL